MANQPEPDRRSFLKAVALTTAGTAAAAAEPYEAGQTSPTTAAGPRPSLMDSEIHYPRTFTGPALAMISFPLGGIGAGSIGLGGRGQLRDWEIFNRPDVGNSPNYAFPAMWVQADGQKPIAHVLEARIQTPYEGQDGLGSNNAPGLSRLVNATFTSEFPRARIQFHDQRLPVQITLTAGTPFIPLDADESGLPVAVLTYRVHNTSATAVTASIAFSIDNPIKAPERRGAADKVADSRTNEIRSSGNLHGLVMQNPAVSKDDPLFGTFVLAALSDSENELSILRGWPAGRWWNSPLLFWDDFSSDGKLGPEEHDLSSVGALCLQRRIAPGQSSNYTFILAWHVPNRTPAHCGWSAPKGHENDIIGNWYCTRFPDAWAAAEHTAQHLQDLDRRTESFVKAIRSTTLPGAVRDAAMSNLSTLVSTTCFRTADGEFHGFEGVDNHSGCCFGNCTHVWNYETSTTSLFPSLSHSLRRNAFGYSMDNRGALSFRQLLPDKIERWGFSAADGQMGQIVKIYLDWQQCGDPEFLAKFWPKAKLALEFAWVPGGWDANRDGVFEGVQHNTYDVEFYGPNPYCSLDYLAALRACEEMAKASGDSASAEEYKRLFESGSKWIDANLFNGEYYIQKAQGLPANEIAPGLRVGMGTDDSEHPQYQLGDGCLIDQLLGQYFAEVAGLGPLVQSANIRKTLTSIHRYNHKPHLWNHDNVQRTFALNDEAAMVICDYGKGERPKIPFPYFAEVMTGFEYATACLMLYSGFVTEGLGAMSDIRRRYDGIRRNPFDEAECGHHYARAMAAWSGILALSGFRYRGSERHLVAAPRVATRPFLSFWSTATAWGVFSFHGAGFSLAATEGSLKLKSLDVSLHARSAKSVALGGELLTHESQQTPTGIAIILPQEITVDPKHELLLTI